MAPLFWDASAVSGALIGAAALVDEADRQALALAHLVEMKTERERFVQQSLGAALTLDAAMAHALLHTALTAGGSSLITAFALPDPLPPPGVPAAQRDAYRRLAKAATIVKRLGLAADEVTLLCATGSPALFDLDAAVLASGSPDPSLFAGLQALVDVVSLRASSTVGSGGLVQAFGLATGGDPSAVASVFGWSQPDVATLVATSTGLGLSFSDVPSIGASLVRLRDAMDLVKRLGVSAQTALGWAAAPSSPAAVLDATPIIQAARSKRTEAEWVTVAPPLRDLIGWRSAAATS
jgi:hypothetical protein